MHVTVSEQFVLLALDRSSGMFHKHLSGMLGFYLAASGLLELLLSDTVQADDNHQVILNRIQPASTGHPHLDFITDKLKKKKQPESIKHVIISLYTWNSRTLRELIIESMEARGLLEKNQKNSLLIFSFTFWRSPGDIAEELTGSLKTALLGTEPVNLEMLSLAMLAAHARLLQHYFSSEELEYLKQRIARLENTQNCAAIRLWHTQLKRAYLEASSSWSI
ncbi:MAG: Golgi phosphoprotein 3 [Paenibacillus sp.]|jgi:hypothetical protein|nr:Golgi phosphoprotein 3 [Paenibacillus sp.]